MTLPNATGTGDPPDPSPPGVVVYPPSLVRVGDLFHFTVQKTNISGQAMTGVKYVFSIDDGSATTMSPVVLPDGAGSGFVETLDLSTRPITLTLRPNLPSSGDTLGVDETVVFPFDNWRAERPGSALVSMWTESNEFSATTVTLITVTVTSATG